MLVVKNKRYFIEASQCASETHGFAARWGSNAAQLDTSIHEDTKAPKIMQGASREGVYLAQ